MTELGVSVANIAQKFSAVSPQSNIEQILMTVREYRSTRNTQLYLVGFDFALECQMPPAGNKIAGYADPVKEVFL